MYYRIKAAAPGSYLSGQKIVLQMGAIIVLLVLLVSMVPIARAEEINGAAGAGAMPRTASAEALSSSPEATATPSPDEELGDQLKDGFSDSVDDVVGSLDDFGNKDLPTLFGGDFKFFLSSAVDVVMTSDLWAFFTFLFLLELILSLYRYFKE